MDTQQDQSLPARGLPTGPVVWDRARWHLPPSDPESRNIASTAQHIRVMLRWLWARGLTTTLGDQAAGGAFSGALGDEPALTSAMVTEPGAIFLDHYYGVWLSSLAEAGDSAFDDDVIDGLWADYEHRRDDLDRVWEI